MNEKYTYFLSDLHLGAPYIEGSREAEKRVVKFLDSIKNSAEAIYLLGDILDYWYEYRHVVPRGFVRFFGKLAELSDSGIKIVWFIGNHDIWIFDYLPQELGVEVIDGHEERTIAGRKFFLSHGDGVGKQPKSFFLIRSLFRSRIAQFFYSGIHPRWTVPFAYSWSRHSRMKGEMRGVPDQTLLHNIKEFVKEHESQDSSIDYYVFGHLHVLLKEKIGNAELVILGDWLHLFSYARIRTGEELELLKWKG